jgi:hypothetical protein
MENATQTFSRFPQFPKELRLRIWTLALPGPCTIEQVWNCSKLTWEFIRETPAVLQACSESRAEFVRSGDGPSASPRYQCIMDTIPFYFCYAIDTIYVRRQCLHSTSLCSTAAYHFSVNNFNVNLVSEQLRSLQMDWGLEPYWWLGSHHEGTALLRSFPRLETFQLVVMISKWTWDDGEKEIFMEIAKYRTAEKLRVEQIRDPTWNMPMIGFCYRKNKIDWTIRSVAKGLLHENHSETRWLYEWANE